MAGNTRLRGFVSSTSVQLERWGGIETVDMPEPAVSALRAACYEKLPKQPPDKRSGWDRAKYNETTGSAEIWMGMETVDKVLAFLRDNQILKPLTQNDQLTRFTQEEIDWWIEELEGLAEKHRQYHDRDGEPGVE